MKNGKYVVLCIDDDRDYVDLLRSILESAGYEVETAKGGGEGIEKYQKVRPDLVIVDLMMEEMDSGLLFVKSIGELGPLPPLYILSSVGADLSSLADFTDIGLTDVLQKPVNPDTLVRLVGAKLKKA